MNSVERVLRTVNMQDTDRVPFGMFGSSNVEEVICARMGTKSVEESYRFLGIDLWDIWFPLTYAGEQKYSGGEKTDYWGIADSVYKDGDSSKKCPLAEISSIDEVERYPWPNIEDFSTIGLAEKLDEHQEFAIIGGVWAPIFHNITWLCGFENTLMNLIAEPEISFALIEKVTDFWVKYIRKTLEAANGKIHIVQNCNDFGAQNGMIMSPELFRTFFKPAILRLYNTIREFGVKIMQHSCGSIAPIIPDLIEMGADILNPIQVSATGMDLKLLADRFGGKIAFYGGIDTQHVLPEGPIDRIRENTRETLEIMSKHGGYILAGSQGLELDIPIEHIQAMFDEGKKWCKR